MLSSRPMKRSASLPRKGRATWSRTNMYPYSPMFWTPLGTILGFAKAAHRNPTTMTVLSSARSTGFVNHSTPGMIGGSWNSSSGVGALN